MCVSGQWTVHKQSGLIKFILQRRLLKSYLIYWLKTEIIWWWLITFIYVPLSAIYINKYDVCLIPMETHHATKYPVEIDAETKLQRGFKKPDICVAETLFKRVAYFILVLCCIICTFY